MGNDRDPLSPRIRTHPGEVPDCAMRTRWPGRRRPSYRALGNAMPVPVGAWIGHRIAQFLQLGFATGWEY